MSDSPAGKVGIIGWRDLTVENAEEVQNFYAQVVGWKMAPHDMGDYHDFDVRLPDSGETVTGICNARGSNANVPAQWLIYVTVASIGESVRRCEELGGKVIDGPRMMGGTLFCVVQDPAGAVIALVGAE